ncbi:hypothetical protein GE061_009594 [Apolygus lucorum]|uniref:C2H2-type domain-containing protein n=1 Tax=Apolygus lucorum TaxID=248454 RepID=A0A8S9Y0M8_APOLU|nr:hypothetical protein GE061_009594 [Apolygus lucorum]
MIREEEVDSSASEEKLDNVVDSLVIKSEPMDHDSSHHTTDLTGIRVEGDQSPHQTVTADPQVSTLSESEEVVMDCLLATVKQEKPDLTYDDIIDEEVGKVSESHPLFYHTWGKPFGCHTCGYSASRLDRLKDHIIRIHTQEKPYTCPSCDYKGRTRQDLTNHKISHSGEKPYACYICDYKAGRSQQLKRHIKQHADDKLYDCAFCNYRADQPGILKTHLRRHTGEKPFTCNYKACGYAAARPDRLKDHIVRTHTIEKPYSEMQLIQAASWAESQTAVEDKRPKVTLHPRLTRTLAESVLPTSVPGKLSYLGSNMSHPTSDAELDINSDVSLDFEAAREMFGNQDRPALSDQDPELLRAKAARTSDDVFVRYLEGLKQHMENSLGEISTKISALDNKYQELSSHVLSKPTDYSAPSGQAAGSGVPPDQISLVPRPTSSDPEKLETSQVASVGMEVDEPDSVFAVVGPANSDDEVWVTMGAEEEHHASSINFVSETSGTGQAFQLSEGDMEPWE